jgi:nicotinamidase-related amidase
VAEALVIVDFQNDFTPGGALGVPDGDAIAGHLNELAADQRFDLVVATRDAALDRSRLDVIVDKGQNPDTEGYSGFHETGLEQLLRERAIDRLTIVGLATDYCVKNTALDALRGRFEVSVDSAGVRGVDVQPGDSDRALDELRAAGADVT